MSVLARRARMARVSPGQIPGLTLWYAADHIAGLANADPVATWADSSGNGRDATQPTSSNRPSYRTNVLNGRPVVRFDGADDWLITATLAALSLAGASAVNIWIVQKQLATGAQNTTFNFWAPDNTNGITGFLTYDDVLYFDHGNSPSGGRISGAQPGGWDDAFHVVELHRSGATGLIVVDGTTAVSGTFSDNLDAASSQLRIGTLEAGAQFRGDIAEMLFYNRGLAAPERAFVKAHLAVKYGITVA